jgi:nucleotide-binding universal stress UspA family protein
MTTAPTCIIAYTSEDGRFDSVLRAAMDTARAAEAKLILYDIDSAPGGLGQLMKPLDGVPLPTEWSADGTSEEFPDRLSPDDLERAGRKVIAQQVRGARSAGIEAFGWLPSKKGADTLAEYARQQGADLIMLPSELNDPSLFQKLRKETTAKAIQESHVPVAVVDEAGHVDYPRHDEQAMGEAESFKNVDQDLSPGENRRSQ